MTSRVPGLTAVVLAAAIAVVPPAAAQSQRQRPPRPAPATPAAPAPPPVMQECPRRSPLPPPLMLRVDPGRTGYVILGRCFGVDRERLQVYERGTAVPPAAVTSLSDLRIEVRSTPQGVVQHKVAVGGAESNVVTTTHCRCNERGICDASGHCACHDAS